MKQIQLQLIEPMHSVVFFFNLSLRILNFVLFLLHFLLKFMRSFYVVFFLYPVARVLFFIFLFHLTYGIGFSRLLSLYKSKRSYFFNFLAYCLYDIWTLALNLPLIALYVLVLQLFLLSHYLGLESHSIVSDKISSFPWLIMLWLAHYESSPPDISWYCCTSDLGPGHLQP